MATAAYTVRETCTTSDARYLTAGQEVTLPVSVGDACAHLERLDGAPTLVLSEASVTPARRVRASRAKGRA